MLKVILIKFVEGDADKIVEELPQMQGFSFFYWLSSASLAKEAHCCQDPIK